MMIKSGKKCVKRIQLQQCTKTETIQRYIKSMESLSNVKSVFVLLFLYGIINFKKSFTILSRQQLNLTSYRPKQTKRYKTTSSK